MGGYLRGVYIIELGQMNGGPDSAPGTLKVRWKEGKVVLINAESWEKLYVSGVSAATCFDTLLKANHVH